MQELQHLIQRKVYCYFINISLEGAFEGFTYVPSSSYVNDEGVAANKIK